MHLFYLPLLAALLLLTVKAQSISSVASTAATAGIDLSKIPLCFSTCAGSVAASSEIGCGSLLNFSCICSNPNFPTGVSQCINTTTTNDCPTLSKNRTALQENQEIFASICKSAAGNKTSSSTGETTLGGTATPTTGGTTGTPTASVKPTASDKPTESILGGTNAAPTSLPSIQHVIITGLVLLPILMCGAYTVL